jgi:hypothetical protein
MKVMNIIGIIGAAIVGYIVGKNHDKIRERINPSGKNETKETNVETIVEQADKPVLYKEDKPKPPDVDINAAKKEFVKKSFEGIYEAIYRVAKGTASEANNVIKDWDTRIHYLDDSPNVRKFWLSLFENYKNFSPEQLQSNASAFCEFIYSTGIERDNRTQLIIDEKTQYKYYTWDDEEFIDGETMNVKFACWTINDRILEKGILTTITE